MSDEHKPDDRLDRATAALRDTSVPEMPADLVERIIAATKPANSQTQRQRKIPMKTILRLAAALMVGASVLVFLMVSSTPQVAFADALTALKEFKTVQIRVRSVAHYPDAGEITQEGELIVVAPDKARATSPAGVHQDAQGNRSSYGSHIDIYDWATGQELKLWPETKRAILVTRTDTPEKERPINIIKEMMDADAKNAKPLGQKEIGGKTVQGFEVPGDVRKLTIWIDPATRLPVQVEAAVQNSRMFVGDLTTYYTDFVWNQDIDPSLVSLDVPPGYQLEKQDPRPHRPDEQAVLGALKEIADFLGGHYPDKLDVYGLSQDIGFRVGMAFDRPDEQKKLQKRSLEIQLIAARVWGFVGNPEYGSDFQYAGKGKKVGTKEPILWYLPVGSEKYHVIDGSLQVTQVAADQLPKVKSQPLSAPPTTVPAAQ